MKDVKIEVHATKDPKSSWIVNVSGASARKFERLTFPGPGLYRVTFSAEHFRTEVRVVSVPVNPGSDGPLRVELIRVQELRGKIADLATLKPVERATITTAEKDTATSGKDGAFSLEIAGHWPRTIRIDAPGYASTTIPVTTTPGHGTLGLIALSHGGVFEAEIQHDDAVTISLEKQSSDRDHLSSKQSKALPRNENHLVFGPLAPGRYRLHISGSHPLEQFASDVEIRDGQTTNRTIPLQPRTLRITVTRQNVPFGDVTLRVSHVRGWEAKVAVPSSGILEEPTWQSGDYVALVLLADGGVFRTAATLDNDPLSWMIEVPTKRLVVAAVDAESDRPVTGASIILAQELPDRLNAVRKVNDAGLAEFDAVVAGTFKATAAVAGYIQETVSFDIADTDTERQVRIPLHKSTRIQLQVTDSTGAPIDRASVITALGQYSSLTDENGFCTIHLAPGTVGQVFVIPPDASMAVVDVDADSANSPLPVVVPQGTCRITVSVKSEDGTAAARVPFVWQFNGRPIPPQVTDRVIMQQKRRFETDPSGVFTLTGMPEGAYQFVPMIRSGNLLPNGRLAPLTPGPAAMVVARPATPNLAEITIPTQAAKGSP
ncbi:MAG TPA: hypothetical protein VNN08_22125 [Thermoanaerobaculia bacterium]|nr:hypothetical protein [Thermoanaerobaculia bacterium]